MSQFQPFCLRTFSRGEVGRQSTFLNQCRVNINVPDLLTRPTAAIFGAKRYAHTPGGRISNSEAPGKLVLIDINMNNF